MDQALPMRVLQRVAELNRQIQIAAQIRHRLDALDPLAQRAARDIFHHQQRQLAHRMQVIAVGDVGMQAEAGPFLRLVLQVGQGARIGEGFGLGQLDRHLDVPGRMAAEEDFAEPALSEAPQHRIDPAQQLAGLAAGYGCGRAGERRRGFGRGAAPGRAAPIEGAGAAEARAPSEERPAGPVRTGPSASQESPPLTRVSQ